MSLLASLVGPVAGLLDKVIPDKDQAAALAHEIATMSERHAQDLAIAQLAVNKEEAKGNWFHLAGDQHRLDMRNWNGDQLSGRPDLRCI
jgi:hypothetical protein